ncbi:MAG TPA: glycosyltransferase family 9 protein [Roseiarcus sp.]|nr:glycosyltransferase family 9 protein [Roseiarcus sp.]
MARAGKTDAILVIKLGSLGDFVQCFDAFHDIRAHHSGARIALLTTPPFAALARRSPWFDEVWTDGRPDWTDLSAWARLIFRLRRARFARVYDLQYNRRSAFIFRALGGAKGPLWLGKAKGCAIPEPLYPAEAGNAERLRLHLQSAGAPSAGEPDLSWLADDIAGLAPPDPFVLFVPGCSPHLPQKRWPAENYAALGRRLAARGYGVALAGTKADREAVEAIRARFEGAIDLCGRTNLFQLASLARAAKAVVGNDTGPMFLAAKIGAPTLTLMSAHTDEKRSAPPGPAASWLKRDDLAALGVDEVESALNLPARNPPPSKTGEGDRA